TRIGPVRARRLGITDMQVEFDLPIEGSSNSQEEGSLINTGVPHVVIQRGSLASTEELFELGLRVKAKFPQDGINVTFYNVESSTRIESVTFERGVERF